MAWLRLLLFSFWLFPRSIWAQESGWIANQVNATMCQWQEPRAAVIRDTVYLDGGYLWWQPGMADGTYVPPTQDGNPFGLVYLLNFSIPFNITSNMSQIFTTIAKSGAGAVNNLGPQYYDGAMFANDGEFYTYGGLVSRTDAFAAPDSQTVEGYEAYWYGAADKKFNPGFINGVLPQNMTRYVTAGGAVSVPSENKGFYFSGLRSASSGPIFYTSGNKSLNADVVSNTLISVDLSTQRSEKWANQTLPSSVPGRANPEIVWVPISQQGALIAIGGSVDPEFAYASMSLNATQMAHDQATNPGLMKTVSIYDVATGTWYNQQTSGDAPGGLTQGCTVVASAQDGTSHNIYWYGGFDGIDETKSFSDDVYVLSVPAFVWTKVYAGTSNHGRAGHKCVKPYPDQMFVIGGYPTLSGNSLTCVEGGLVQVFNLSSATWMTSYDPTVWTNYSVPSTITQKIGGTGAGGATQLPSAWSSQSLSTLFSTRYDSTKIKNWYPYSVQQSNGSNPRQTAPPTPVAVSSGLPSWVAPVLGVVLGLVFISALIVFFLLWRRRRYLKRNGSLTATSDMNRYRILSWVRGNEGKTPTVTSEETPSSPGYDETESSGVASPHVLHAEAAGTQIYEMPDTSQVQELSGTGMQYLPTNNNLRSGLIASPSQVSHTSHASRGSNISHVSKDSISSAGAVSPVLASSTPRADSPSLGGSDSRSRFMSGVSATSSQYQELASAPDVGAGASIPTVVEPQETTASSPAGNDVTSPVSPPTPQSKEGADYLSGRPPPSSPGGNRKSNFGEMLDE